ncbi:hypothetical protein ACFZAV_25060 [Streptomyces sp. NPDC008343]|uniref:hypothetical protein n=1 Tax=Streptomyces sp. NPDC008343 TaxID=3364828 RepID=UPI0036F117A7
MTVEDPPLAAIFTRMTLDEGDRVRSAAGVGDCGLGPDLGVSRARRQSGAMVILVQVNEGGMGAGLRTLFPRYVEAEAARLGRGPLKLKLPRPGREPLTPARPPYRKLPQIGSVDLRVG